MLIGSIWIQGGGMTPGPRRSRAMCIAWKKKGEEKAVKKQKKQQSSVQS
jgi:hypothetical protein